MRSGKPPAPWRRRKGRSISLLRILLISVLLAAGAVFAIYKNQPPVPAWTPVGSERMATPSMDIAGEAERRSLRHLQNLVMNRHRGRWLGDVCAQDSGEIYVLTRVGLPMDTPRYAMRLTVRLNREGEAIVEQQRDVHHPEMLERSTHLLDEAASEQFRGLLIDGGYPQRFTASDYDRCHGEVIALESCVHGRYFGVFRGCPSAQPSLRPLADEMEAFVRKPDAADRR